MTSMTLTTTSSILIVPYIVDNAKEEGTNKLGNTMIHTK